MRILMVLALIFCFGCSDDDFVDSEAGVDAAVEASVQEAAVEASVQPEASVDAQPVDVGGGEVVASDAQSE
jgi:hypothetical protein